MKRILGGVFFALLIGTGVLVYLSPGKISQIREVVSLGVPRAIPLSGTGSMYPTFPKGKGSTYQALASETVATPSMYRYPTGISLFKQQYLETPLGHGDLVSFESDITRKISSERTGKAAGFVKRVIGVSGDTIELRSGIVYRNKQPLKEPYVARAQSTFGGEFLPECEFIVPANNVFVLGDNRKGSNDSRHSLGFVSTESVDYFLPYHLQLGVYDSGWHDPDKDLDTTQKISLDRSQFMKLLNDKRREQALPTLKYNDKLELSAKRRGEVILRTNDFSYEATRSGYTMASAMREVGYKNIVWAELPIQGYYESDELFEHLYEFSNLQRFLLDKDFQDFAITTVQGNLNNCPAQVIVMHVAGYRPPNYSTELIDSWKRLLTSLQESAPGWREAKNVEIYYERHKADLDRMIELFDYRISNIESIVATMESNQWLNESQEAYVDKDVQYSEEQRSLAERLNQP